MISGSNAGFGRRFAALVYDVLLVVALLLLYTTAIVMCITHEALEPATVGGWAYVYRVGLLIIIVGYTLFNWLRSGQTLGMRAWRLRAVTAAGRPLDLRAACARYCWGIIAWAPAGLGVLWLYYDRERLALQDRLSNTRSVLLSRP